MNFHRFPSILLQFFVSFQQLFLHLSVDLLFSTEGCQKEKNFNCTYLRAKTFCQFSLYIVTFPHELCQGMVFMTLFKHLYYWSAVYNKFIRQLIKEYLDVCEQLTADAFVRVGSRNFSKVCPNCKWRGT